MNRQTALLLFLGMTVVTYIPRMLPVLLLDKLHLGPRAEKFLKLIPYTAMSALVFPGVFRMDAARPWIGLAGAAAAALLAWKKCPAIVCVLAAVAVVFGFYLV